MHALILECIHSDPRWDRQLESRAGYYSDLIVATGMELASVSEHLFDPTAEHDCLSELPELLGELAVRAHPGATETLRRYVYEAEIGDLWLDSLSALMRSAAPNALDGLDAVVCARFPDDAGLAQLLSALHGRRPRAAGWIEGDARLSRVFRPDTRPPGWARAALEPDPEELELSVNALLERAAALPVTAAARIPLKRALARRVRREDVPALLARLSAAQPSAAITALAGLQALALPETVPAVRDFLLAHAEQDDLPFVLRHPCFRFLASVSCPASLAAARAWFDHPAHSLRVAASQILETQATREDLPRLRTSVIEALEAGEMYRVCAAMTAFAHVAAAETLPEIELAFAEATYARARLDAARAWISVAPTDFKRRKARECLWDCEPGIVRLGAERADLRGPLVLTRVQLLARDPWENYEKDLREAAAARLGSENHS